MLFILITFFAAFSIELIGTYVSVIGLSTLFGANPVIIALAIALDIGKLVVVSLLYKYWDKLGKIMKGYALIAAAVTMIITSAGAAGYLSGEFQKAIVGTQESSLKVNVLKSQIAKYEERKKQIDAQIAALPVKTSVSQRLRLMNGFKQEQTDLQAKIADIDKQLPELQIAQIGVEAKAGPILYIAKAFDIPVEQAVTWVIMMIIFVFDPLAVFLIIAGNFLLDQRRANKNGKLEAELEKLHRERHDGEPSAADLVRNPISVLPTTASHILLDKEEDSITILHSEEVQPRAEAEPVLSPVIRMNGNNPEVVDHWQWGGKNSEPIYEVLQPTITDDADRPKDERETITLSSLGFVTPDPHTITDTSLGGEEVGYKTGVFTTKRPN